MGLLSGGLDSTLAAKLMIDQGINVYLIHFTTPFDSESPKKTGRSSVSTAIRQLGNIPLMRITMKHDFLEMLIHPKYGYGKGMNPCIDCRIISLKKAGQYMEQIGASFIFIGEVVGQRPMSQHKKAMNIIDQDSGLQGYILRPLSAALLEPTTPEKKGWIDRNALLSLSGRSRKGQIALARQKGITDYPSPAGGCLLTDKNFSERFRDYLAFTRRPSLDDIPLLKVGRHFRLENGDKIIVARDEQEGEFLISQYHEKNHLFFPEDFSGPVVMLKGDSLDKAVEKMMQYTNKALPVGARINYWHNGIKRILFLGEMPGAGIKG
ncbi:MAG: hypothetical protein JW932_11700 [Deltaproteobacteria bacterium]|nr:hypothetical protein [Deltaproteobacteria bacterium]